jgi:NAD(P)-dependent dehydrogenase (short-subunit alcohol dehydrogenase family)
MKTRANFFVTGASSGIGRATAVMLARRGATVFAAVRKPRDAEALKNEHVGTGAIVPLFVEMTDSATIAAAANEVEHRVGDRGLDGLVNNAGIGLAVPLEYVALDEVRHVFEVNLVGQLAVTQALLPAIRRARGRIVNIGSIGTHLGVPFGGVLNASKSALTSFNDSLRLELMAWGVRVILIEPAAIATPAVKKTLGSPDATVGRLPEEAAARYGATLRAFMERARKREERGSPPEAVAKVIVRALESRSPRTRYLVGKDARPLAYLPRLLPRKLFDRLELRILGVPSASSRPITSER